MPLDGKPFAVSMGLRSLDESVWLERNDQFDEDIALKRHLYETQFEQVFQSNEQGLAGSLETFELIANHLEIDAPADVEESESHPLIQASLLVQEDLCIMSNVNNQWKLTAASVCFPSRWDLKQKINTDLFQIHHTVPHYEQRIGAATDAMFYKFTEDRPVWRLNWTILNRPDLYQPASSHNAEQDSEIDQLVNVQRFAETQNQSDLAEFAAHHYLRIERQTLRCLPSSKDVLFTIRTYVDSLANLAIEHPEFQSNLGETLRAVSEQTRSYKGWDRIWERLLAWSNSGN